MTYDDKCYDLAIHFLQDESLAEVQRDIAADRLAQEIQSAVECFLGSLTFPMFIMLNGVQREWSKYEISYDEIEALVYGGMRDGRNPSITVLYLDGTMKCPHHGQSIPARVGMRIDCCVTGNA